MENWDDRCAGKTDERIIGDTWACIGDTRDLSKELVGDGALFRLRIRGDSMINAAIADGDIVVVRQQSQAENGDAPPIGNGIASLASIGMMARWEGQTSRPSGIRCPPVFAPRPGTPAYTSCFSRY